MMKATEDFGLCPVCRKGHLVAAQRIRVFEPNGKRVEVPLQTSVCDVCEEATTKASQHKENLRALAARKAHYGKLLMGEEILALRKRYGLTQQQASRIFGKGKIAFSRYESETSYPDESTTLLMTLAIEKADAMKWLADKAGVDLPLWTERCEDEQRVKLRPIQMPHHSVTRKQTMRPELSIEQRVGITQQLEGVIKYTSRLEATVACNDSDELLEVVAS